MRLLILLLSLPIRIAAHSSQYCCIILLIQIPRRTTTLATGMRPVRAINIVIWWSTSATATNHRMWVNPVRLSEIFAPRAVVDGTCSAPVKSVNTIK